MQVRHISCRSVAVLGLAALALAGCGKGAGGGAAKDSAGADAGVVPQVAAGEVTPRAGQWEMRMVLEQPPMPGASGKPKERVGYTCLTPEQAAGGHGGMFSQAAPGCAFQKFAMGHGQIEARLHCVNAMGDLITTMAGDYTADSYKVRVTNSGKSTAGRPIATSMVVTAHHTGACNAETRPFGTGMVGKLRN